MLDAMDFCRIGILSVVAVGKHGGIFPAAFPQFVAERQVIVGAFITVVMSHLGVKPQAARAAFKVRRDYVPGHTPARQVVQGRKAPGQQIRWLIGG